MTKSIVEMKNLVLSALFAAMIFVSTAYIFHIPHGTGYIHIGDAFVYLAASVLPTPYAMAAGAIGGALADGLTGFPIWIIPTIIIKAVTAICFTNKSDKIICKQNIIAFIPAALICAFGYGVAEYLLYGSWVISFVTLPALFLQPAISMIVYLAVGFALDKIKFKKISH